VEALVHTDADFVLRLTADGRLLAASGNVRTVLGWDVDRGSRDGLFAAIEDEAERAALRTLEAKLLATGSARGTVQVSTPTGQVWLDVAAKHLRDEPGSPVHISARDVSEDIAATSQLLASEQQWRVAFEHSPIGGALLDADGAILLVNDALCAMLGWRDHEMSRLTLADVLVTRGRPAVQPWAMTLRVAGDPASTTGAHRPTARCCGDALGSASRPLLAPSSRPSCHGAGAGSSRAAREAELQLANARSTTAAYGLPTLPHPPVARQRAGGPPGQDVGVLYCDLDASQVVNDSLGPAAGDKPAQPVADRCAHCDCDGGPRRARRGAEFVKNWCSRHPRGR
jgi:PAS domain-containing protein